MTQGKNNKTMKNSTATKSGLAVKQSLLVWTVVGLFLIGLMFWAASLTNKAMSAIPIINNGYNVLSCWPYGWPANTQKGTRGTTSDEVLNNLAYQKFYVTGEAASSEDHMTTIPAGCDFQNINVIKIEPTGSPCIYFDSQKNFCVIPLPNQINKEYVERLEDHIATRITGTATDSRIRYQFCDGTRAGDYKTSYSYHRGGYKITFQCAPICNNNGICEGPRETQTNCANDCVQSVVCIRTDISIETKAAAGCPPAGQLTFKPFFTYYSPSITQGGFCDINNRKLTTIQDFLAGRAKYVSIALAADTLKRIPYCTTIRIPKMDELYQAELKAAGKTYFVFKRVDNGGSKFIGLNKIDICVDDRTYGASEKPELFNKKTDWEVQVIGQDSISCDGKTMTNSYCANGQ